ncbi:hypothetical protein CU086_00625 [Candidatus Nasuia deltocephalinicola]|uniref:Uncharacterized protein n=1 Tax=Candidatus Nasuia deltocephalincola TaxID=1160784 RepID=A0A975A368_9PROT|nr:hypothetical protein CU086_00625 [Candidatus Nasuia deltocephalinicola]
MIFKNFSNKLYNNFYKKRIKFILKKNKINFLNCLNIKKIFILFNFDKYLVKIYKNNKISKIKKKFFLI